MLRLREKKVSEEVFGPICLTSFYPKQLVVDGQHHAHRAANNWTQIYETSFQGSRKTDRLLNRSNLVVP